MKFTLTVVAAAAVLLPSRSTSTDAFVPKTFLPKNLNYNNQRHHQATTATFTEVPTAPIAGMKPGTSGLRKKVEVWQGVDATNKYYVENFIQSLLDTARESNGGKMLTTMIVAGDGRYFNAEAIQIICRVLAANGVENIWVPKGGIMSTPAVSAAIRTREGGAAEGGIILTASHNPGGPGEDFGIKYNEGYGQPAGEEFTDAVSIFGLSDDCSIHPIQ
jgi:phosphoglucomutase